MRRFRLVGIVLFSIGLAVLISGAVITIVLANTNPDYNYSSYTGFRFPDWLYYFIFCRFYDISHRLFANLCQR